MVQKLKLEHYMETLLVIFVISCFLALNLFNNNVIYGYNFVLFIMTNYFY